MAVAFAVGDMCFVTHDLGHVTHDSFFFNSFSFKKNSDFFFILVPLSSHMKRFSGFRMPDLIYIYIFFILQNIHIKCIH